MAIDPGVHFTAWAVFDCQSATALVLGGGYVKSESVFEVVAPFFEGGHPVRVVIEKPVKYPDKKRTHKDIDRLLVVVKDLQKTFKGAGCEVTTIQPVQWKANTPKTIHQKRIVDALTATEMKKVLWPSKHLCHNVFDALGLGLFATGRLGRGGRRFQSSSRTGSAC